MDLKWFVGGGLERYCILTRLGTRLHFELMVIIKVDTINDKVVTTGHIISKQRPWAIYSAPMVHQWYLQIYSVL